MKIWQPFSIQSVKSWEDLRRFTTQVLNSVVQSLSGNLTFADNMKCQSLDIGLNTSYGFDPTSVVVNHKLGVVPTGMLVAFQTDPGNIFIDDVLAQPTKTQITISTDNPAATFSIILLG